MSLSNPIKWVQGERISWPLMCLISYACGGLPFGFDRLPSVHRLNRKRINYSFFLRTQSPAGNKFRYSFIRSFLNSLHVYISDYHVLLNALREMGFEKENGRKRNKKVSEPTFLANCIAFESLFDGCFARKTKCVWKSQSTELMHPFEMVKWIP